MCGMKGWGGGGGGGGEVGVMCADQGRKLMHVYTCMCVCVIQRYSVLIVRAIGST